jgi:6-phosphofructokinase
MSGTFVIAQGGGPTTVINQTLAGALTAIRERHPGAFAGADLDFRSLPGIYVGIVMGRHAGFLTAASAAWRMDAESAPHLVYVPERAFDRYGVSTMLRQWG